MQFEAGFDKIYGRRCSAVTELGTFKTRSGQIVTLRFICPDDAPLLADFFDRLSYESRRLRFHLYTTKISKARIWDEARKLSDLNPQLQVAIAATIFEPDRTEQIVGVARFVRATPAATEAEVAVVVRDDFQRKGLGKHLLLKLAEHAREMGVTHFTAWVLAENVRLMKLIRGLEIKGLEKETRYGETRIRAPID
ncbi:MAG: GNAT family N-acetyltransferase [Chloroflexi bacterium]|nr:MAG: GNAT family N-acetyltransferase [Chloroflexota bacterium]